MFITINRSLSLNASFSFGIMVKAKKVKYTINAGIQMVAPI